MYFDFKVPSVIPQDLLLIQDLIGTPPIVTAERPPDLLDSSDDSIASTDSEVESEDEVEADLVPHDEDSGASAATSDSGSHSDSDLDTSSSSDSEEGHIRGAPARQIPVDDVEDEESGVISASAYPQTKNEIVDANVTIPTTSEVEPSDKLEKVGEIISIVGNIVIVRGRPVGHANFLSERALDAESLLVFEDRKVLGHIYETFGPTSQPLYQVKFNQHYPLDTNKVWLSREVFHVPQRSHFVFVDQLEKLRGSDASNIHDEEPADDEVEFSDDEEEAAFRAERKKRRGYSISSSRQLTPAPSRILTDDMVQDTYRGSNPYDAHGPYDDDYHITQSSRPSPVPYDDPYADIPTSDTHRKFGGRWDRESHGVGPKTTRGHVSRRGIRRGRDRNRQPWNTTRPEHSHNSVGTRRTFDPDTYSSIPATSRTVEYATGYGHVAEGTALYPFVQPASASNAWFSPEANNIQNYPQSLIQPHINPRFASLFGLDLPGTMIPYGSQRPHDQAPQSHNRVDSWTTQASACSGGEEDAYRPL